VSKHDGYVSVKKYRLAPLSDLQVKTFVRAGFSSPNISRLLAWLSRSDKEIQD